MIEITFHGVRGSFPSSSPETRRYGGSTAAVELHVDGEPPIFLDLGSGLPQIDISDRHDDGQPFRAAALVTHLHLDHVQGLPFFPVVHQVGTTFDVYAPRPESGSVRDAFARLIAPPYFPLSLDQFLGDLTFHEVCAEELTIGRARVAVRPVPHVGPTVGYRIEWGGATIAYVSDHQAPPGLDVVDPLVLELCRDVDLLIHEGQYTREEFAAKWNWGHGTIDFALRVAMEAGARRLCVFHHDPWRSDDELDALLAEARKSLGGATVEIMAAAEGMTLTLGAAGSSLGPHSREPQG
jgi:phosphoribosyl 1,2-cyclic phosphodiesterase